MQGRTPTGDESRGSRSRRGRRRRRRRIAIIAAAGVAFLALAVFGVVSWTGRNPDPTGQVLAVVNGREVTVQDVRAEARGRGVALTDANRPTLLAAVIDRALLAQEARARGIDRAADYPSDRVRAEQMLLAGQLTDAEARSVAEISDLEAKRYVDAHPLLYADRQDLTLDQVSFAADDALMQRIGQTPTMSELLDALSRLGVPYAEDTAVVSTADMDPELGAALLRQPEDGVVLARQGRRVMASALMSAEANPPSPEEALADAKRRRRQEISTGRVEALMQRLRAGAEIVYNKDLQRR